MYLRVYLYPCPFNLPVQTWVYCTSCANHEWPILSDTLLYTHKTVDVVAINQHRLTFLFTCTAKCDTFNNNTAHRRLIDLIVLFLAYNLLNSWSVFAALNGRTHGAPGSQFSKFCKRSCKIRWYVIINKQSSIHRHQMNAASLLIP